MAVENLVIKFDVDTKELDFGIKALETLGKVDKATADAFRANNAAFNAQKTAISEIAKESKATTNEVKALSEASKAASASTKENTETTKKSTNAFQALRQEIRSLKAQILDAEAAGDNGLVEKLRKQAAVATDRMGDLNKSIKNLSSDTRSFDAILGAAKGVAAGFSVAQGASALFGSQNKDLERTLIKLQGALALLNGLTEIQNVLQADSAVGVAAASAKRVLLTGVTVGMTTAEAAATIATNLFNAAVKSLFSPIGLILTAVGGLVTLYEVFSNKTDKTAEAQERLTNQIKFQEKAYEELDRRIKGGTNAAVQASNDKLKILELEGASEKTLLTQKLSSIELERIGLLKLKEERIRLLNDKGLITRKEIDSDEKLSAIRAQLSHLDSERSIAILESQKKVESDIEKQAHDKKKEQKKKETIDHIAIQKDAADKFKEFQKNFDKEDLDNLQKQADAKKKAEEKIAQDAEKAAKDHQDKLRQLKDVAIQGSSDLANAAFEIEKANRDAELNDQLSAIDIKRQAQFDSIDAETKHLLENKNLTEKQRQVIEENAAKKKKVIDDKLRKEESAIKRKAFEDDKRAAIIQAIINTALAVVKALPAIPLAIAAGIAGAAQIAVISSQPTPKFAKGVERLSGQGTETSDSIHAMLSKGERVVPADVNNDYFPILSAIHHRKIKPNLLNDMAMGNLYIDPTGNIKEKLEIDEYAMARAMSKSVSGSSINIANHEALAASIASKMNTNKNFF